MTACVGVLARECGGAVHPHVVAGTRDPFPCCERCAAFAVAIGFDIRPHVPRTPDRRRRLRSSWSAEAGRRSADRIGEWKGDAIAE